MQALQGDHDQYPACHAFTRHVFQFLWVSKLKDEREILFVVPGMFSWFPILFPLREPVQLKADDEIVLHFWRNVSTKHVWYVLANQHLNSKDV